MIGNQTLGPTTFGQTNCVDPNIGTVASAATISPISHITRITGAVTIDTINPPHPYFNGPIYLLNTDAAVGTISTSGNVALGVTLTRYKLFALVYDPSVQKWYPSNIS